MYEVEWYFEWELVQLERNLMGFCPFFWGDVGDDVVRYDVKLVAKVLCGMIQ